MPFTVARQNANIENQILRFKRTKVPSSFNEESVGWNLDKRMIKYITSARLID